MQITFELSENNVESLKAAFREKVGREPIDKELLKFVQKEVAKVYDQFIDDNGWELYKEDFPADA